MFKSDASERKVYNPRVKASMYERLSGPGSRHKVHRISISAPFLLPQLLLPQASAAGRGRTLTLGENRILKG